MRTLDTLLSDACEWMAARPWRVGLLVAACILAVALVEVPS